jgi:hypothetical protein
MQTGFRLGLANRSFATQFRCINHRSAATVLNPGSAQICRVRGLPDDWPRLA